MAVPKPKARTKVVHIKDKYDVYIGRPSIFGNPFRVFGVNGREKAINQFKDYFYNRTDIDPEFYLEVMKLEGKTLGCFCKPLACHGDIIAEFVDDEGRKERKIQRDRKAAEESTKQSTGE